MELVDNSCIRTLGGNKRVAVSKNVGVPSKMSLLETLPHEILVKVLCGVDHEDLEHLFYVSKTIREATLLVEESHFRFNTPKKTTGFHYSIDLEVEKEFLEIVAPNAPLRKRRALFASMDEEQQ